MAASISIEGVLLTARQLPFSSNHTSATCDSGRPFKLRGSTILLLGVYSAKTKFRLHRSLSACGGPVRFVSSSATSVDNPQTRIVSQSGHRCNEFARSDNPHKWYVGHAEYFSHSNIASFLTNKQLRNVSCSCQKLHNIRHLQSICGEVLHIDPNGYRQFARLASNREYQWQRHCSSYVHAKSRRLLFL